MDSVARILGRVRESRLAERLRDERGFTLVELLSAQLIGGFVVTAAISMLVIGFKSSARVTDRVNSAAQGRIAMEEIQQRLRSQTCLYSSEYAVSPATQSTSSSVSFLHADPNQMAFFTDLGASNSNTAATTGVGFSPKIRYLLVNPGPTTGISAFRKARFIDGEKGPSNTSMPFIFNIPVSTLADMSYVTGIASAPPTTQRAFADGITNIVSGATTLPIFRYYDGTGLEVTATTGGYVPAARLGDIDQVQVNFRILGQSGIDGNSGPTASADSRTAEFSNDIYLKTLQTACE